MSNADSSTGAESAAASTSESVASHADQRVHIGRLRIDPSRQIYAVIVVLATLAVVTESSQPVREDIAYLSAVVFAPMFALMMAHVFAEAAALQIGNKRRLTWHERWGLLRENAEFLWITLVFVLLLIPAALLDLTVDDAMSLLQIVGLVMLLTWGYVVAGHAQLHPLRRITMALSYMLLGLLIILVEAVAHHL